MSEKTRPDTEPDGRPVAETSVSMVATVSQVAEMEGVSERTVRRWCESEKVDARKNDEGRWRIDLDSIPSAQNDRDDGQSSGENERDRPGGPMVDLVRELIDENRQLSAEKARLESGRDRPFDSWVLSILDRILP